LYFVHTVKVVSVFVRFHCAASIRALGYTILAAEEKFRSGGMERREA
jgi:hypothetical protein